MVPASQFRILVLDDEIPVLEVMSEILERTGWTVDAFSSAAVALTRLKRTRYDALVLDLYMPEIPGLLFHSKLKFIDRHLWSHTVFVSGHFSTDDLRRSLESSPRFVPKPFKADALVAAVETALADSPRSAGEGVASVHPDDKPVRS
jgi:two-component system OmpR family response regulator